MVSLSTCIKDDFFLVWLSPSCKNYYLQVRDIFLTTPEEKLREFCVSAYNFIISVALQFRTRFDDFKNVIYASLTCLSPQNAMSPEYRENNPDDFKNIITVFHKIVGGDEEQVTAQWENLINLNLSFVLKSLINKIDEFWFHVMNVHDEDGNYPYTMLATFALIVLSTPHANADPERIFSAQNNCKTKNRNKLQPETVSALLRARTIGEGRSIQCSPTYRWNDRQGVEFSVLQE